MENLSFLFSNVKRRDSNIELLRIVSMILVLVTHACYVSLGLLCKKIFPFHLVVLSCGV